MQVFTNVPRIPTKRPPLTGKWESIGDETTRMRIEGGWLYRVQEEEYEFGPHHDVLGHRTVSKITFVPYP